MVRSPSEGSGMASKILPLPTVCTHQRCVMKPQDQRLESRMNVACGSLAWVGEEKPSMASTEPEASLWGKMENVKPWSIIKWSANASTPINTYSRWKCPAVGNVLDNVACTMINTRTLDSCFKESILSYIFYAPGSLYILDSVPLSMWYSSRSFILNVYLLNI